MERGFMSNGILEKHIKQYCSPELRGLLSLSVTEAYRFLDDLIKTNAILQRPEMKQTHGYIRKGLVDVAIKEVFSKARMKYKIADKTTSKYRNGHTYLMVEVKGAIITPAKVVQAHDFPRAAKNRTFNSLKNRQMNLFSNPDDINAKYDKNNPPYMIITYGGSDHKLEFVRLGLPLEDASGWIDQLDITKVPVLLANKKEIVDELNLSLTKEATRLIEESEKNGEYEVI